MVQWFVLVVLFALCLIYVNGTHFLGGTITWRPLNASETGTPVAIVITQTYSWTYSVAQCTSSQIANSQPIPISPVYSGVTNTLDCIINCGSSSAGYVAPPIWPDCTDVSSAQGTTVGQRSDIVYLKEGDYFTVAFQDSSWRSLQTASVSNWSVSALIDVQPRSDNGLYNNAPVATVMSPIYIPVNQATAITVPVADSDGDVLRCRWSTGANECGQVCPPGSLPSGTTIFPNCTIIIVGAITNAWYAVTLMVEDFINSSSTTPLSSVPAQFLVQVIPTPACTNPPEIVGVIPEQSCTPVVIGQTFTSQLIAMNNCGSTVSIVDISTLSFAGMVKSSIIKLNSTTYYKTLSWTPDADQVGSQVMCAMAVDSQNSQSAQNCFKFFVSQDGVCACPGDICPPTSTTTTTTSTATTSTTTTATTSTSTTSTTTTATTSTSTTTTTTTSTTTTSTTTTATTSTSTTTTATTSTTTTSTTATSTTTSTTTSALTTSSTSKISIIQSANNLPLGLGLGLGLGLPLLLLLSALVTCLCCLWCPGLCLRKLRRRFWEEKDVYCELCGRQCVSHFLENSSNMPDDASRQYRQQYINDYSWPPKEHSFYDDSFPYDSLKPSDCPSIIATRTTLLSSCSINVMPSEDIPMQTMPPVRSSNLRGGGSILVRAYVNQEQINTGFLID